MQSICKRNLLGILPNATDCQSDEKDRRAGNLAGAQGDRQAASAVDAANKIVPVCRGYLRALSALRNRPGASGAVFHASKADQGAKIAFARGRFFTPARFGEEGRNGKAQSAKTENTSIAFAPGCTGDSPAANAKYAKYPACFAAGFSRFGKSLLNHQKTLDSLERIWYSLLG